jgi:hypothetical protein
MKIIRKLLQPHDDNDDNHQPMPMMMLLNILSHVVIVHGGGIGIRTIMVAVVVADTMLCKNLC